MGFQNKTGSVTVTAKLTDVGKKYLLTDPSRFSITKFSPFDDEVDYSMWNPTAANGNAYYGAAIESLPTLEPVASNIFQLKYNLIRNMDRTAQRMPIFTLNPTTVTLEYIDSVTYVNCVAWDSGASLIHKFFYKGKAIIIHGKIINDNYEKDGEQGCQFLVRVNNFEFPLVEKINGSSNDSDRK